MTEFINSAIIDQCKYTRYPSNAHLVLNNFESDLNCHALNRRGSMNQQEWPIQQDPSTLQKQQDSENQQILPTHRGSLDLPKELSLSLFPQCDKKRSNCKSITPHRKKFTFVDCTPTCLKNSNLVPSRLTSRATFKLKAFRQTGPMSFKSSLTRASENAESSQQDILVEAATILLSIDNDFDY